MPKATANVDYRPVLRQDDIRLTRQTFHVQTISKPLLVQVRPHDFFRGRVFAFDLLHGEMPLLGRKGIHGAINSMMYLGFSIFFLIDFGFNSHEFMKRILNPVLQVVRIDIFSKQRVDAQPL